MPTNPYINLFTDTAEQSLVSDLITESIYIYGHNVYYIPREINRLDTVYREDVASTYSENYPIEMYIKSIDGFEGDGVFLSKFNIEVRNQVTLTVSIKRFKQLVGDHTQTDRPLEGALIWFPLDHKLFVIKNVNKYSIFYQIGSLQVYDLVCEVFEYNNEVLTTGIQEVDGLVDSLSVSTSKWALKDVNGNRVVDGNNLPSFANTFNLEAQTNAYSDNAEIAANSVGLIDFSENNPFSTVI